MNRTIKTIIKAQKVNMGGILLDQALPQGDIEQVDPFLLIHHWTDKFKGGQKQENVGVGPHPHRGFAPVTLIFEGAVHHRDSEGFDSVVHAGGTQWMNSGRGIIHSERPTRELAENGGLYEIIQFWVNAPSDKKMEKPFYQALTKEQTPKIVSDDGKATTYIVAGKIYKITSPIETYSPMVILRMEFEAGGRVELPIPGNYNALVYVLNGQLNAEQANLKSKEMAIFNNEEAPITLMATESTRAILLSGAPIDEPLATYGPFVMNDSKELMNAIQDYQEGKMGNLEEKFF